MPAYSCIRRMLEYRKLRWDLDGGVIGEPRQRIYHLMHPLHSVLGVAYPRSGMRIFRGIDWRTFPGISGLNLRLPTPRKMKKHFLTVVLPLNFCSLHRLLFS